MISYRSRFGRALRFDRIDPGDALINRGQRRELQVRPGLIPVTTQVEIVRAMVRVSCSIVWRIYFVTYST